VRFAVLPSWGLRVAKRVMELPPPAYFRDAHGQRHVRPYTHTFRAYCKARWVGRPLHAVFAAEFASHDAAYFSAAIALGCITVNGCVARADHALRDGDRIEHCLHRHEPPVPGEALRALRCEGAAPLLAICKPAGVPTHACGAHHHLAVPALLAAEAGHAPSALFTVHRLDRVTSGVLLLGRTRQEAVELSAAMRGAPGAGPVRKRYLALVRGAFPQRGGGGSGGSGGAALQALQPSRAFAGGWEEGEGGEGQAGGSGGAAGCGSGGSGSSSGADSGGSVASGRGGQTAAAAAASAAAPVLHLLDLGALATEAAPLEPPCPWVANFTPQTVSVFMAGDEGEGEERHQAQQQAQQLSLGPGGVAKKKPLAGKKRGRVEASEAAEAVPAPKPERAVAAAAAGTEAAAQAAPEAAPEAPPAAAPAAEAPCVAWTQQGYLRVHVPLRRESYRHAVHGVAMTTGATSAAASAASAAAAGSGGGSGGALGAEAEAAEASGAIMSSAGAGGSSSTTLFRCIATQQCKDTGQVQSLVEAIPLTGRSHQIRVHLAYLGHPIHDDPVYCAEAAARLRAAVAAEEGAVGGGAGSGSGSGSSSGSGKCEASPAAGAALLPLDPALLPAVGSAAPQGGALAAALARVCAYCTQGGARAEFSPMQRHVTGVCLHALEYCGWAPGVQLGAHGAGAGAGAAAAAAAQQQQPAWRAATPVPAWALSALGAGAKKGLGAGAGP
jgi:23S rRNA-/tRNA-specific pseudouridylate synthase